MRCFYISIKTVFILFHFVSLFPFPFPFSFLTENIKKYLIWQILINRAHDFFIIIIQEN